MNNNLGERQLKNCWKAFVTFFLGLVSLPSWHSGGLEDDNLCSQCGTLVPGFKGGTADLICNYIHLFYSKMSGGLPQVIVTVLPILEFIQGRKAVCIARKHCKQIKNLQLPGAKDYN